MLFEGKKALVTGAARGIGQKICYLMAEEGAAILAVDYNEESVQETAETIRQNGGTVYTAGFNVVDYDAVKEAVTRLAEEAGGLDIVVNCAGVFKEAWFTEMTPAQWKETVDIDLNGPFNVAHAALPYVIKGKGSIINIVSQDAFYGCPGYSHYSASKAGLVGWTRTLARELGQYGVRCNCVAPGITMTEMTKDRIEEGMAGYLEKLPVGRIGRTEDIANSVVFLASDKAGYITGQVLHTNGGMYLG